MKEWIKGLAMAAVLAAASLGFAACSSDNDDDGTPEQETPDYSKLIVGRWLVTKEYNPEADVWQL